MCQVKTTNLQHFEHINDKSTVFCCFGYIMSGMEVVKKRLPSLETTQRRYVSTNLEVLKHLETVLDRVKDGHKDGVRKISYPFYIPKASFLELTLIDSGRQLG